MSPKSLRARLLIVTVLATVATPSWAMAATAGQVRASLSPSTVSVAGGFVSVPPVRLLDTRVGTGAPQGALAAASSLAITVDGHAEVPTSGVRAVLLNVTVTTPAAAGYLTVYAADTPRPSTSNLNFTTRQTVANLVMAPLSATGQVALYNGSPGSTQLVADVTGYVLAGSPAAAGTFTSVGPVRLLDTRHGTGAPHAPVAARGTLSVQVSGAAALPASGVGAVILNLTATGQTHTGAITAYSTGIARPAASNLNLVPGRAVSNLVIVQPGPDGKIYLYDGSDGPVNLIADVAGYFRSGMPTAAGTFVPVTPDRLLDSRSGDGATKGAVAARATESFAVPGRGDVPADDVGPVVLNVTATGATRSGYLTAYTDGLSRPGTSNLDFTPGVTVPAEVVVSPGASGKVSLYNGSGGSVQMIADVGGYFLAKDRVGAGVWSWGDNEAGQLGTGDTTSGSVPRHIDALTDVTSVAGGAFFAFALLSDGTVWEWGQTDLANPPDQPTPTTTVPVQVPGLFDITAIAGSGTSGYARRSDGTVWAWGEGTDGRLGDGSQDSSNVPVQVSGLTNVTAISSHDASEYALRSDGTVWAWGYNSSGELGDGTLVASDVPVQVSGLTAVTAISGNYALRSNGTVWAWGPNLQGQLGNAKSTGSKVPIQVPGLSGITGIGSSIESGFAIAGDGSVRAWGWNEEGQLGDGSLTDRHSPVKVSGLTHVTAIAGQGVNTEALTSDGTVWAWGFNAFGQTGAGSTANPRPLPARVTAIGGASAISVGTDAGYALVG